MPTQKELREFLVGRPLLITNANGLSFKFNTESLKFISPYFRCERTIEPFVFISETLLLNCPQMKELIIKGSVVIDDCKVEFLEKN